MNRSIRTLITTAVLSAGALGAAGAANAAPDVHVAPRPYPGSAPVYVYQEPQHRVYDERRVYEDRRVYDDRRVYNDRRAYNDRYAYNDDRRGRGRAERCGAERWNPNVRYAPGDIVWRNGELYQARRISNQVYNENSPPEWTPSYWRPARCN